MAIELGPAAIGNRTQGWQMENLEAVREAVSGYMRSRNLLLENLLKANPQWYGFEMFATKVKAEIEELDRKVFVLLHKDGMEHP